MHDARLNSFWDRRLAKRNHVALEVYLLENGSRQPGKAIDISRRGAFIETRWSGFVIGGLLDMVFVQRNRGVVNLSRYTAVVVRRSETGLAVRFCWSSRLERIGNVKLAYEQKQRS